MGALKLKRTHTKLATPAIWLPPVALFPGYSAPCALHPNPPQQLFTLLSRPLSTAPPPRALPPQACDPWHFTTQLPLL